jgi:hypothetical protein
MVDLFNYSDTQRLADVGMQAAIDHADDVQQGWSERAFAMLEAYARTHPEFMTEEARVWAHEQGLPQPPDKRAWGAVAQRAARTGVLGLLRYQKTRIPPAHATPRPLWRSHLYGKDAA